MKLVLDLPSLAAGVVAGVVLASTPFGTHWLLDYDGVSVAAALACVLFLAGVSAWLLWPRKPGKEEPRANGFAPTPRPGDGPPPAPALRPMEWLEANDRTGADWKQGAQRDFAAQIADGMSRPDIVGAISAAVCVGMRRPSDPLRELERLAAMVAAAEQAGDTPEFGAFAADLMRRYGEVAVSRLDALHDHSATRLVAVVKRARRQRCPVAPATLSWLKRFDRALWYALQNIGSQAMFVEGAGISVHFTAEEKARRGIEEPQVDEAVYALDDYLKRHGLLDFVAGKPAAERAA